MCTYLTVGMHLQQDKAGCFQKKHKGHKLLISQYYASHVVCHMTVTCKHIPQNKQYWHSTEPQDFCCTSPDPCSTDLLVFELVCVRNYQQCARMCLQRSLKLTGFKIRTLANIVLLPGVPSKANKITDNMNFIISHSAGFWSIK